MGDGLRYERFLWFHGRLKAAEYPNAGHLACHFEVSNRTAQRDIEFMRERLNAPFEYDAAKKGYCCTDQTFELPSSWINEDNIIALSLAVRLASSIPDTTLKKDLCRLIDSLPGAFGEAGGLCYESLTEKVSVKNIEYSKVDAAVFHETVKALFGDASIKITYHSPHDGKTSSRLIHPLHLMHYMGSWYLLAFCTVRRTIRDFALSRIKAISPAPKKIDLPNDLPPIKEYTRKHFGIMQGGKTKEVVLRFSGRVAEWVEEQIWHPEQKAVHNTDRSLTLTIPASDFREIKRRVLSYGADVEVVAPEELRIEIKKEITALCRVY